MDKQIDVAVIMGSDSDLPVVAETLKIFDKFGIKYSVNIASAHRTAEFVKQCVDNAVANGANGLTSFTYSATENPNSLREARTLAVQNAQDAAALIAGASGCKVADVLDIQEGYNPSSYSRSTSGAMLKSVGNSYTTPIEAGNVEITSTVTITFSLAN